MKNKRLLGKVAAVAVALLLWQAAAIWVDMRYLFAAPSDVLKTLLSLLGDAGTWGVLWRSCHKIILGFLIGLILGAALGILAGRFSAVEIFLWPYMVTVKSVPVASFIVIALIWVKTAVLSTFISVLIVLPIIYNNILGGIRGADRKMTEMADVFSLPLGRRLLYIWMPAVKPFLLSAVHSAAGLAFKSGVAAEVIGLQNGTVGEMIHYARLHFESAELFAWTILIVVMSALFERAFSATLRGSFAGLEKL
ncbi:MAG: ABC transporter permease subunit [Clostridia bacterium]|nr:ABC transporter permease subunit [Clostridia bacterium]